MKQCLIIAMLMFPLGCAAGARMARKDASGGEIAIWGPLVPATEMALEAMLEHCDGRYRLIETRMPSDGGHIVFECAREAGRRFSLAAKPGTD